MKSPLLTISASFFLATLLSACSLGGISYKTEKLEKLGLKVDKPSRWTATKTQSDEKYVDYVIDIPQTANAKPTVNGHIAINVVKPLPGETVTIKDEIEGLKKFFAARVQELKTVEEVDATLLGQPAKRVILEFRNDEDKTIVERVLITLTVKDSKAYTLILDEDLQDFDTYLPVYEKMAQSMEVL